MKVIIKALLLVATVVSLLSVVLHAQQSVIPKRIFILDWYDKDDPRNIRFGSAFQAALQSVGPVEIYTDYLETNRFPGEAQAIALRDYLKRKYAGRSIDVVVANSDVSLDFLLKHRQELFPQTPIVFIATRSPSKEEMVARPGLTGTIVLDNYEETLDLALRFHPATQQVFVVSGTLERDKRIETLARKELQSYEGRLRITYLTDLSLEELIAETKNLPERSIVLHAWQQAQTKQGKVLESADIVDSYARSANVPVYGMSFATKWLQSDYFGDGSGIVGGYVNTAEVSANKTAEIVLRILNGAQPSDIPVERAPEVLLLNWRQLKRWGISENALPPGSVVRFRELSAWQQYKWYVIGALALVIGQAALIGWLLVEQRNRRRAEEARRHLAAIVESSNDAIIGTTLDGNILSWNEGAEALYGYNSAEALGRNISLVVPPERWEEFGKSMKRRAEGERIDNFETIRVKRDGSRVDVSVSVSPIRDERGRLIADATITRDISERKQAEKELQNLTGRLIHLQDEERRRIAGELHDSLGQSLVIIKNRAMICLRDTASVERVTEQLEEISSTASSAIDEVHEIAHNLRPYELDRLGLVKAVETMVHKLAKSSSIEFSTELDPIDGLLSHEAETSVYRIIQEGLNNVVKHAEATEGTVSVKRNSDQLVIYVSDNGNGIREDPEELENGHGLGLAGVAERARMLGGSSAIQSDAQTGTKMIVTVQLPEVLHPN